MLSFRSILLAAAAFATVASAIPAPQLGNLPAAPAVPDVGSLGNGLPLVGTLGGNAASPLNTRGGQPSCADLFQSCHNQIAPIIVKIGKYRIVLHRMSCLLS